MTENLSIYIPMDRRLALAHGEELPERTRGAALFADISGFTPLTEALAQELGPKRGAEELSIHLNRVYEAIIAELHRYRGSVIGFSGDAITCWLDADDGSRAVATALAMQRTMEQFSAVETCTGKIISLAIKTAVVKGSVRRFVVGDPDYVLLDVAVGDTLVRLAAAEGQASSGDVILDEKTAMSLGDSLLIRTWVEEPESGARFAIVSGQDVDVPDEPWPILEREAISDEQVQDWLLPGIFARLQAGQGAFLTELRPAIALFLCFCGVDYEHDDGAHDKLNIFVQQVEHILTKYDGSLTHLTIGDKGSYFCIAFGAPVSHEDDPFRAVSAALELKAASMWFDFIEEIQIGITQGRMWTGAYGSSKRRTYDILGDDANLAARLMTAAEPGQITATEPIRDLTREAFDWEDLPQIRVKGKAEDVQLSRLIGSKKTDSSRLHIPEYNLPMVGRSSELQLIEEKLALTLEGEGQIVGITGEAGIGKSRLVAEVVRMAEEMQFLTFGGECQSYGTNTSYLPWQNVMRSFFEIDPTGSQWSQMQALEDGLMRINPSLAQRLPLLGTVINLKIPDNDLTGFLAAKVRKSSLESLLAECFRARAKQQPLLLILEDCHWLDPLSHDLIVEIGRALSGHPIMMLLVYRPPELHRLQALRVSKLPYFSEIELLEFSRQEADQLIQVKMAQFFGEETEISPVLMNRIKNQAQGNPFYIEELINYLQDIKIDPQNLSALDALELPGSIYNLILSRLDQLTERQQITMKVASVIGRLFEAAMVWGVYSNLGDEDAVLSDLDTLCEVELTRLESPEPELSYLFKHIFTQQVAYESLLYSTREKLHEAIGQYIEQEHADSLDQFIYILAHHYENTQNEEKKRTYLIRAGETAQKDFANEAAIEYFQKALPLLSTGKQIDILIRLGKVFELVGKWQEAEAAYEQALTQADELGDQTGLAWAETAVAELFRKQGCFDESSERLTRAKDLFSEIDDLAGLGQVLHYQGTIADQQGDFESARNLMQASLEIRQQTGDQQQSAYLLGNMGIAARRQGKLDQARALYEQSLALRREIKDRWGVANVLNNLGNLLLDLGDQNQAQKCLEEAVAIHQELGDRWAIGNALNNLANVLRKQDNYPGAKEMYNESLAIYRDLGDKWALAYLFEDVAWLAALEEENQRAIRLSAVGAVLREEINAPLSSSEAEKLNTVLEPARKGIDSHALTSIETEGRSMSLEDAIVYALN